MIDPPQPNQAGQVVFGKCGKGNKIENYAVVQTIDNLNALILDKYNKEKGEAKAAGKSVAESETKARAESYHLPQFKAGRGSRDQAKEGARGYDGRPEDSVSDNTLSRPQSNKYPEEPWVEHPCWRR